MNSIKTKVIIIFLFLFSFSLNAYEDYRFDMWAKNLKNENVLVRKNSARSLGVLQDKRAIPFLMEGLNDPKPEVRASVCMALGFLQEEFIVEELTKVSQKDSSPMVKSAAKRAIYNLQTYLEFKKEKQLKEMKDALQGKEGEVKSAPSNNEVQK